MIMLYFFPSRFCNVFFFFIRYYPSDYWLTEILKTFYLLCCLGKQISDFAIFGPLLNLQHSNPAAFHSAKAEDLASVQHQKTAGFDLLFLKVTLVPVSLTSSWMRTFLAHILCQSVLAVNERMPWRIFWNYMTMAFAMELKLRIIVHIFLNIIAWLWLILKEFSN